MCIFKYSVTHDGLIGPGVDTVAGDGYYSALLYRLPGNGRFPIKVRAAAGEGGETLLVKRGGSRANAGNSEMAGL